MKAIQIITTTSERKNAEEIAGRLIKVGLAGCVQVLGPITSTYRWKGGIRHTKEWMCIIKTEERLYKQAERLIRSHSGHEVPEVLAFAVICGSKDYLKWLRNSLRGKNSKA